MGLKDASDSYLASLLLLQASSLTLAQLDEDLHDLDVPYVPTCRDVVRAMLEMGRVNKNDLLFDLGCGDGRIVVSAAKQYGARAIGVDLNPDRIKEARANAKKAKVEDKVDFLQGDLLKFDFSLATVVTMYLLPGINLKLRPRLLSELQPGTRILSHDFNMGDWKPDKKQRVGEATIYMWTVPASIEGLWQWRTASGKTYKVDLKRHYQLVSGSAWIDDRPALLQSAELLGKWLRLTVQADESSAPASFIARFEEGGLVGAPVSEADGEPEVWEKLSKSPRRPKKRQTKQAGM